MAAASGSVGALTFVQGRSGPVIRTRTVGVQKQSAAQLARRGRWALLRKAWQTLPGGSREAWRVFAAEAVRVNRLGVKRQLSGFQWFLEHNGGGNPASVDYTSTPPANLRIEAPEKVLPSFLSGGVLRVKLTMDVGPGEANVIISGSRPVSGKDRAHFGFWRWVYDELHVNGSQYIDITADWDAVLGHPGLLEVVAVRVSFRHETYLRSFEVFRAFTVYG